MKNKLCEVLLVSEDINDLNNWLLKIEKVFNDVNGSNFRECYFDIDGLKVKDYRIKVQFRYSGTKNEIYKLMNEIKANPITFLK